MVIEKIKSLKEGEAMKSLVIVLIGLSFMGCGTIEARHSYAPQKTANWKALSNRVYQFECNGGKIEVSSIVLQTTAVREQEKPWLHVRFSVPKRIERCSLSFIALENQISGEQVAPISSSPNAFNNDRTVPIYDCYYYFDIKADKGTQYILHVSDKVLGCAIDPISYNYKESTEWIPIQLQ
jgi:hypothetical protein